MDNRSRIEAAFENRSLLKDPAHQNAVLETIEALDKGKLRVASPPTEPGGAWTTHVWVKHIGAAYGLPCALIIGQRKESTDQKTSLNAALRDFGVSA
jgi:hypothetical protein